MSDSDSVHSGDESENETTTASTLVVTKYNMAADICNEALKLVSEKCVAGAKCGELCDVGDQLILERTSKVFKKDKKNEVKRGVAFPTCISVNNIICHFSPLREDEDIELKDGDVVKIDLGVHIDGYIATAAHTLVVGASKDKPVSGKVANAIWAAYNAQETVLRMLRPGQHKNTEITDAIARVVESYGCKPIENMLSYQLERDKIDAEKQIIQNPGEKQRFDMKKCDFEVHDVFAIDILVSTGEGKAREGERRTTIYKKDDAVIYQLKLKHSRQFLAEVIERHGNMPFTLRSIADAPPKGSAQKTEAKDVKQVGINLATAKLGVKECVEHSLMKPYPVYCERDGEFVAQFKATVLIMPTGLLKITGMPAPDPNIYKTECTVKDEKLAALLKTSLKPSKKAKAKKKKAAASQPNGADTVKAAADKK